MGSVMKPPLPPNETERLAALRALDVLDSVPEAEFDALVQAASLACGTPISLVTLVDAERQWFKANVGLPEISQTPREVAFCAYTILQDDLACVPDATQDPRFADNPLVTGPPHIRFYAGAPIRLSDDVRIGTLCVIDRQPKQLDDAQLKILNYLAQIAANTLEGRRAIRALRQSEEALQKSQEFLDRTGQAAGVGGWEVDLATNRLQWTAQTCRILGVGDDYDPEIASVLKFFVPEAQPIIMEALRRAAEEGIGYDLELALIQATGGQIWVRCVGSVVFTDNKPVRVVGAIQDVTNLVAKRLALAQANERVSLATDSGGIGIWDLDLATNALICDPWVHRIYGLDRGSDIRDYDFWRRCVHPEDLEATERALRAAIDGVKEFDHEFRIIRADGDIRHIRSSARVIRDSTGKALRMVGANWDVSEPKRLATKLAEQYELLQVTLRSIGDAVITSDAAGNVLWLNPVAERMTGWPSEEAKGRPLTQIFNIVNEETRQPTENPVLTCLAQGKIVGLANHTILISRHGEEFGIADSAAPIRNDKGQLLGVVMVFHDVTEQRRMSGEMSYRATHDTLTGLVNRTEFETRLRGILQKSHEDRSRHALLYIDLDQFKLVNDSCGHTIGDLLLQQVSKLLTDTVRSRDTLARLGGDEFAIILEQCGAEQALRVAQQICDKMDQFRFTHDDKRFRIGASIGLVPIDNRWPTMAAVLQAADTSCYAAKEAGRNRVHVWFDTDKAMRARHGEMQWTTRIEHALDEDRFVLFGQKIMPLGDANGGLHAEILLRMQQSDGSLILPGAFLPAAERFHLASRTDRWVVKAAIGWMKDMPCLEGIDRLSVNLSGQSVGDRTFHRWIGEILSEAGPKIRERLCFEVTETAAVTNIADATLFIEQLHDLGVSVSLDDFGAGASSFGYLKNMPVDYLKIDGQFIRDLIADPLDAAAVRCFVDVARVIGIKTVAECVEQSDILAELNVMGVDFAQGYLIHKPVPITQLVPAKNGVISNRPSHDRRPVVNRHL